MCPGGLGWAIRFGKSERNPVNAHDPVFDGANGSCNDCLATKLAFAGKEIAGLRFSISHNLPNKNYGGDLLVENDTEKFDQLLDAETDVAVYGHVHKQLLRYGSQGQQIINPGSIGMPYFNWEALKNHRAQYAVIEVEDGELVNIQFRKVAYDYEAELELAKSKGLPFIEMYEELRRDDNYQGHNLELLASLIEKHGYVEDVKNFFDFL